MTRFLMSGFLYGRGWRSVALVMTNLLSKSDSCLWGPSVHGPKWFSFELFVHFLVSRKQAASCNWVSLSDSSQ